MENEKIRNDLLENDDMRTPLFTGDFKRDNVVTLAEKAAEVSRIIFDKIANRVNKFIK